MTRTVTLFLPTDVARADLALAARPSEWLPHPVLAVAPDAWVVTAHAGPLSHAVRCRVGEPRRRGDEFWRSLSWRPSDATGHARRVDRLLPQFTGEIGVLRAPTPTLVLTGTYDPPGAAFGSAIDAAALERVAEATARRFVADVARQVHRLAQHSSKRLVPSVG